MHGYHYFIILEIVFLGREHNGTNDPQLKKTFLFFLNKQLNLLNINEN